MLPCSLATWGHGDDQSAGPRFEPWCVRHFLVDFLTMMRAGRVMTERHCGHLSRYAPLAHRRSMP